MRWAETHRYADVTESGEYLACYAGTVGRGNGTRLGPLLRLYEWWRHALTHDDADARRDVWQALCAALLADL